MSRSNNGKCPDIGQWCGFVRELCDGDCMVKRIEDLDAENERLKAALKPVQDAHIPDFSICDTCRDRSECEKNEDSETCEWYDIVEAVRKSQTIYNGGAK